MAVRTLRAFTDRELARAKVLLAAQVASMMGRKLEEGDWSTVYCRAKDIPEGGWSNLYIDVNHNGIGVEIKLLRARHSGDRTLKSVCGQTLMHPSATRSIRIDDSRGSATEVMNEVFGQYAALIRQRTARVWAKAPKGAKVDMRTGWLIWERNLAEFLYFEEPMLAPDPEKYFAEWHDNVTRGVKKPSRSLWIYDRGTKRKRYSITTSAGIKIQPYFDVPPPSDENLYYFRVQSEPVGRDTVLLWVTASTAEALKKRLGSLGRDVVSMAILEAAGREARSSAEVRNDENAAVPVAVSVEAHERLTKVLDGVNDEHRVQLLLRTLS